MLVLSRKVGESIIIGEDISVCVVESTGRTVKLGIDAPRGVAVHRKEVYDAIKNENMRAIQQDNVVSLVEYLSKLKKD